MKSTDQEIKSFVKNYFKIYFTERDFSKLLPLLSPEITVIGTGLHEFGKNTKETLLLYKKDLEEVKTPIDYTKLLININIQTSNFCLVTGNFSIKGTNNDIPFIIDQVRYSLTISKESGEWKVVHLHISTPNNLQEDNELYPLQKLIKQNKLLNEKVEKRTKKLLEANQRLTESNKTKEKLFSLIAHDIKSPFNSLLGFVDLLKNQYDDFDANQHKKFINYISNSSNKIYNLADNLLIWSKLQQDKFNINLKPINLTSIVDKSVSAFNEMLIGKQLNFSNKIEPTVIVWSDEFMLSTILRNLISNAIKYSNTNGLITVRIHNINLCEGEITICVEDTGIGMSQKRISELFLSEVNSSTDGTNNEKGSGLGLSLCKEFINLHETKIWVESSLKKGSTFYFNLKNL